MFKNQPKGLLAASLANMGERFGFYTMMAILSLFLMAKYGLDETKAGIIYSVFYFSIYILAFVGGLIADKRQNYKGTILLGLVLMSLGYFLLAIPTPTPVPSSSFKLYLGLTCFGLLIIAFGNGFFKGNLQALVGQMYDNEQFSKMRDEGFSLFYMFINVGAIFAPFAAIGMRNWWLTSHGFDYHPDLPALCHDQLNGVISSEASLRFQHLATQAGYTGNDLTAFANQYLSLFTTGFHYAFAIAIAAMLISLVIFIVNKKYFPDPRKLLKISPKKKTFNHLTVKKLNNVCMLCLQFLPS